jgi:hypothetical protein
MNQGVHGQGLNRSLHAVHRAEVPRNPLLQPS